MSGVSCSSDTASPCCLQRMEETGQPPWNFARDWGGRKGSIQKACTALQGSYSEKWIWTKACCKSCASNWEPWSEMSIVNYQHPVTLEGLCIGIIGFPEAHQLLFLVRSTSQVCKAEDQVLEPKQSELLIFISSSIAAWRKPVATGRNEANKQRKAEQRVVFLITLFLDLPTPKNSHPLDS